jgi:membrane protein DedA with SNARE-associated domain
MKETVHLLAIHGYSLLVISVLPRQACLPVPANLVLLAAGALAGSGKLNFGVIVVFSVLAFLSADLAWFAGSGATESSISHVGSPKIRARVCEARTDRSLDTG